MRRILFLFLLPFVSFCCMHLYFMFTAVSYHMSFHWCSFMYPDWGFWNKPLDLTWLAYKIRKKKETTALFGSCHFFSLVWMVWALSLSLSLSPIHHTTPARKTRHNNTHHFLTQSLTHTRKTHNITSPHLSKSHSKPHTPLVCECVFNFLLLALPCCYKINAVIAGCRHINQSIKIFCARAISYTF